MKDDEKNVDENDGFLKTIFKGLAESVIINVIFNIILFIPRIIISIFRNL